ncbi:ROK family transcriptional regulator [Dactylosporangium aurantiacum]|uniref:ROK family transcriptional regulator n=1 Tax=Dactylosporangium aurantiacum TaxID=35754 RepID=A0A9Q9MF18_9ACTN|nr:ROK family transcriptional regulator [Dactylosporangium aurantiacum]MDG6103399.1 ROK family transcriptional regulator [Dactylosporangium aurantiacum]UWZ52090.1 ROK family transcriptional regulator [Dactylosporangium aurantiacum]
MTHLGGSSKLLRAMNDAAALSHVLERGTLTRSDLRELTGLSKPTISEALRRLTEAKLVTVVGYVSAGPGPNAEVYAVNPDAAYSVALSVRDRAFDPLGSSGSGLPAVSAAVTDLAGTVRGRLELAVDFTRTDPVSAVVDAVQDVCKEARIAPDPVAQVQIAVAGSYDPRTDVLHHVEVPGWGRPGLVDDLRRRLGVPVGVDNDVNLAAVAERAHGAGRDAESFALLWLGEAGLGLAIDLGGTLLRGARGGAGEIGYMPMMLPGVTGGRGFTGRVDFQDLVGGGAVLDLAAEYGLRESTAAGTMAAAVARAADRDDAARSFVTTLAGRIAIGLSAVVAVLDPPLVVIGGEVGQAGGPILGAAVATALAEAAPLETAIATSTLQDDAALLGAQEAGRSAVRDSILATLRRPTN